jgi:uncharacterized protein
MSETVNQSLTFIVHANPWLKVGIFFLMWLLWWSPVGFYLGRKLQWQFPQPLKMEQKIPLVISLYLFAPLVLLFMTLSGDSWLNYGLSWQLSLFSSLFFGLIIGVLGILLTFAGQFYLNLLQWHQENLSKVKEFIIPVFGLGLVISFIEELIFRGFLVYQGEQVTTLAIAGVISSLIFALLHLIWDYKSALPQLLGLFVMGMVLVLARVVDHGSLGLAIGLHTGWILTLTCVDSAQIITYKEEASPWLIGFQQQPLAGISGIVCLLMSATFIYFAFNLNYL